MWGGVNADDGCDQRDCREKDEQESVNETLSDRISLAHNKILASAKSRAFDAHASFLNDAGIPVPDSRALNAYFTRI